MKFVAVFIGGFFGAILRYGVGLLIPTTDGFPLGTLLINLSGSLFLAWLFTITSHRLKLHPLLILGLGTGLTGAFTTFSTFSLETLTLLESGRILSAVLYVLLSLCGGIGFAFLGFTVGNRRAQPATQLNSEG